MNFDIAMQMGGVLLLVIIGMSAIISYVVLVGTTCDMDKKLDRIIKALNNLSDSNKVSGTTETKNKQTKQ